jgi:hypothetical protein
MRNELEHFIDEMHQMGKIVISTNYPTNPSGRLKKGTPRPRNADLYSYMVYTSLFGLFGNDTSKDNIVAYAGRRILDAHGLDKGCIDLGLTSKGVLPKFLPVTTLERVISEVAVCKYLEFKRIHIFALDEIRLDVKQWMQEIQSIPAKAPPMEIFIQGKDQQGIIYRFFKKFLLNETYDLEE